MIPAKAMRPVPRRNLDASLALSNDAFYRTAKKITKGLID